MEFRQDGRALVARQVYLPAGQWRLTSDGSLYDGCSYADVAAPIDYMPVFEKVEA